MEAVGIYKITSPSGKVYIGQSWNISKRWKAYMNSKGNKQKKLYNSFSKYGKRNHSFEVVHILPKDVSQEVLDDYEAVYMESYNSIGVELLNSREAGSRGKHFEETKRIMSEMKSGIPSGIKPMLGKKHSDRVKQIISKANKGRPLSEEHKKKIGAAHKGKLVSEETRERMRVLNLGKKLTPESIAKRTATFKANRLKRLKIA